MEGGEEEDENRLEQIADWGFWGGACLAEKPYYEVNFTSPSPQLTPRGQPGFFCGLEEPIKK